MVGNIVVRFFDSLSQLVGHILLSKQIIAIINTKLSKVSVASVSFGWMAQKIKQTGGHN